MIDDTRMSETHSRLFAKLYSDLGEQIIAFLSDKLITEIMLNSDGKLWIDSISVGQVHVGNLSVQQAFAILNGVAAVNNFVVNSNTPFLEATLPSFKELNGQRFTGQIPPVVARPTFTIRKRSEIVYSLDDYCSTGRMTSDQKNLLKIFISNRKNILVCGGPGSGKTTVTNALIIEAVKSAPNQRIFILEDTPELQCQAENKVEMMTTRNGNLTHLVRTCMRMKPDRMLIGEVRGEEAFDVLKAWNTGCQGGICTIHANGAKEAIQRILDLSMESGLKEPPISLVLHTINVIVSVIPKEHEKGFIKEIFTLEDYKDGEFQFKKVG